MTIRLVSDPRPDCRPDQTRYFRTAGQSDRDPTRATRLTGGQFESETRLNIELVEGAP